MLKVYNTLSKTKEIFQPLKDKKVNIFICGPTVYDYSHIGHGKTYTQFDVIVKYLRFKGYKVFYLQNITDIDDKIINRAKENNTTPTKLAREYEKYYHEDMKALEIDSVNKYARATDYIKEILSQIKRLKQRGFAYQTNDGIYYDISKFVEYGKLSGRTLLQAEDAVSRIDEGINKKNKGDFCLWKFSKLDEPSWNSEFGKGRPGWHIEDTAITEANFGPQYDIHGGAIELAFPHHEAEIAQMESISGKRLVKYWLHTGFLNVNDKKMSKSLGNFITIRDTLKKYNKRTLRLLFISTHYKSQINYTEYIMEKINNSLKRIDNFITNLYYVKGDNNQALDRLLLKFKNQFERAMDNDFDTPTVIAALFDFIREINKLDIGKKNASDILRFLKEINKIFCIFDFEQKKFPKKVLDLVEKREELRKANNFKEADKIREELAKDDILLEDTKEGIRIKYKI